MSMTQSPQEGTQDARANTVARAVQLILSLLAATSATVMKGLYTDASGWASYVGLGVGAVLIYGLQRSVFTQLFIGRPVSIILFSGSVLLLAFSLSRLKPDSIVVECFFSAFAAVGMYVCISLAQKRTVDTDRTSTRGSAR